MRIKLPVKIILSVVLVQALMLVIIVINSVRLINTSNESIIEQYIRETNQLLSVSLHHGLVTGNSAAINEVLSLIKKNQNLVYVSVYNRKGKLLGYHGAKPKSLSEHAQNYDSSFQQALNDNVFDTEHEIVLNGKRMGFLHVGYSVAMVNQYIEKSSRQNTTLAAIGLLLSIIVSILLGVVLTRNLRILQDGADALERGQLDHRIKLNSNDEINDVARSFNKLAEHLQKTQASLQNERQALEKEANRLETLLNGVNAVLLEVDPDTNDFIYVSEGGHELLGYPVEQWLQPGFWIKHIHPDEHDWVYQTIMQHNQQPGDYTIDYRMLNNLGDFVWVRSIHSIDFDSSGNKQSRGIMLDISKQKKTEERIVYLAERDALTGLLNRRRFQEELDNRIAYAKRFNQQGALLFIDLDEFKYINDTMGHQAGDECLLTVSRCISSAVREIDILARLGGDEFAVLLPRADKESALKVAENLIRVLEKEVVLPVELAMKISASIGITLFPTQGISPSELLAKADAAMYTAKRNGRNQVHVYQENDTELVNMKNRVHWEDRINKALKEDLFVLHYQPVIEINSGRVAHYEALLRMNNNGELIFPSAFLDTAERFNLIREIDKWVLRKGIEAQANSIISGEPINIAINLSGRHFGHHDIMHLVQSAIKEYNADPAAIIFEVTETAAVENISKARTFIESLRGLGCRFALDDFGMGYSSFHYLKNLPVDMIKIDGSFVRNLHQNEFDRIIVKAMSDLANGMNITTVAEFVENKEIYVLLEKLGVDYGQGYHLGMPDSKFVHEQNLVVSEQV